MKVMITKVMLKVAVQGLAMVVPHKPVKAVFGCVRITAKDGNVRMIGMDLEQWVEYRNDGVEAVGEVNFLFRLSDLKELIKVPGGAGKVIFEVTAKDKVTATVQVNGRECVYEYKVPEVSEFPEEPVVDASPLAVGPEFFQKLRLALPMVTKDKINPVMGCISIKGGQIVATNRRELIVFNYELGITDAILLPPPKVLSLLDTTGTIVVKGDQVEIKSGMWRSIIKQAPGTFPEHQQIVPKPSTLVTQFSIGDTDRATLLNTLEKLKINETYEPVTLYGDSTGGYLLAGMINPTVIRLSESTFHSEKPDLPLFYTLAKDYLLDALRIGFNQLRSADGHLLVAQAHNNKLGGYLILMSLSGRFNVDQITDAVNKSIPNISTNVPKTEIKTMSNEANVPAKNEVKPTPDFKVVESSAPADAFANLNAALDKLHVVAYNLSATVNEVSKQVREAQRNVKQRDRSFKELQVTIDRFKKVANF